MKIHKFISAIIIFIITLVLVFLFVMPKYKEFSDLQQNLAQKQADYNGKSIYYAKIAEIIKSIDTKKDALAKIDSALPSDFTLSPLIYFFQKKGAENGLIIKSISWSQTTATALKTPGDKIIKDVAFNIQTSGTYGSFKSFLLSLDKSARLFEVNTILFSTPSTSAVSQGSSQVKKQSPVFNFSIVVKTHTY